MPASQLRTRQAPCGRSIPTRPEFAWVPVAGVFDGELVALGKDGLPSFDRVCRRMLHRESRVPVALVVFDVLELDGVPTAHLRYLERREQLEAIRVGGVCELVPRFDDGAAPWDAVISRRLEGMVAKKNAEPYRPVSAAG